MLHVLARGFALNRRWAAWRRVVPDREGQARGGLGSGNRLRAATPPGSRRIPVTHFEVPFNTNRRKD